MNQQLLIKKRSLEKIYYILPFITNKNNISEQTQGGDNWMCQVTPNDGEEDGDTKM